VSAEPVQPVLPVVAALLLLAVAVMEAVVERLSAVLMLWLEEAVPALLGQVLAVNPVRLANLAGSPRQIQQKASATALENS
jgi:hypothetical protein